ncbi:MAG: hypothetical protein FJ395_01275 [Verrucomicrobia bacterium]|nr:hypothetical protein [Verrucomicrobiota bacterium]
MKCDVDAGRGYNAPPAHPEAKIEIPSSTHKQMHRAGHDDVPAHSLSLFCRATQSVLTERLA